MSCVICPILPCGLTYSVGIWFVFNFETCLSPVLITPPCVFKPSVSPGSSLARLLLIICTCLIYPDPCTLLRHLAASSVWAGWSWWDFRKLRPLFRGSLPKWRKPLGVRRIWFWRILRGMLLWNRREQQVGNINKCFSVLSLCFWFWMSDPLQLKCFLLASTPTPRVTLLETKCQKSSCCPRKRLHRPAGHQEEENEVGSFTLNSAPFCCFVIFSVRLIFM